MPASAILMLPIVSAISSHIVEVQMRTQMEAAAMAGGSAVEGNGGGGNSANVILPTIASSSPLSKLRLNLDEMSDIQFLACFATAGLGLITALTIQKLSAMHRNVLSLLSSALSLIVDVLMFGAEVSVRQIVCMLLIFQLVFLFEITAAPPSPSPSTSVLSTSDMHGQSEQDRRKRSEGQAYTSYPSSPSRASRFFSFLSFAHLPGRGGEGEGKRGWCGGAFAVCTSWVASSGERGRSGGDVEGGRGGEEESEGGGSKRACMRGRKTRNMMKIVIVMAVLVVVVMLFMQRSFTAVKVTTRRGGGG
mmetsp:Transcript_5569/g.12861  ORF Transcript_5569/g.12861 Transcript_5569/m.12861 type:complete len:305 (+) Transcript_5569:177-1091(+)